jgi:hypothetical protein
MPVTKIAQDGWMRPHKGVCKSKLYFGRRMEGVSLGEVAPYKSDQSSPESSYLLFFLRIHDWTNMYHYWRGSELDVFWIIYPINRKKNKFNPD